MNKETQIRLVKELDDSLLKVLESKGFDYADSDVLSNFKQMSSVAKILKIDIYTPLGYALFMGLLKVCRIGNLIAEGKTATNEPLKDSLIDLLGYNKLAYLLYVEANNDEETPL